MVTTLSFALALILPVGGQPASRAEGRAGLSILFLGNSHTAGHQLPDMVKSMLESGGEKVQVKAIFGAFLDDLAVNPNVLKEIDSGNWTFVVLQGARLSSSHRFEYSKMPGIDLAKRVLKKGKTPVLFAEHPRRGWDEAAWQYAQYQQIQTKVSKDTGGKAIGIAPVCYAYAEALKRDPKLDLWEFDGNHANLPGSYLSAATIAWFLKPGAKITFVATGVGRQAAKTLLAAARNAVKEHR
ncbi:MAG: hypothetical protein HZC36_13190 [Armatimonadetes bacterium]|nr:hypothetical protein [Armatimonadota bacterium]